MNIDYLNSQSMLCATRLDVLYLVDVSCDDETFPLLFDTGASMTVVSKSTAERLCAKQTNETVIGGGNAGSRFTAATVLIPRIMIGCAVLKDLKAVVVDDNALDFGEDGHGNHLCINGFLGWDVIQHFRWWFDTQDSCFIMAKPNVAQVESNMENWDNMPIIRVKLNGKDELFGFDSGNTETVLGNRLYSRLTDAKEVTDSFAGIDGVKEERVRSVENFNVQIGQQIVTLCEVPAVDRQIFPTKNEDICGLLAADILKGRNWTLDYFNRFFEIQNQ